MTYLAVQVQDKHYSDRDSLLFYPTDAAQLPSLVKLMQTNASPIPA